MNRRDLLKGSLAVGAAAAFPARVFAQVNPTARRDARLLDVARAQVARVGDRIWKRDMVGIADFALHSAQPRFHFVDLANQRVESFLVTHGTGSDSEHDGWLKHFSNVEGSLATSRGAVLSKQDLADRLYPHDEDRESNVIEVLVGRLRRKLDPDGRLDLIETLRGRGYRLAGDDGG